MRSRKEYIVIFLIGITVFIFNDWIEYVNRRLRFLQRENDNHDERLFNLENQDENTEEDL